MKRDTFKALTNVIVISSLSKLHKELLDLILFERSSFNFIIYIIHRYKEESFLTQFSNG